MMIDLPATEIVSQISEQEQNRILREHFYLSYQTFSDNHFIEEAGYEEIDGIKRYITGIPYPFFNLIFNSFQDKTSWDASIEQQLNCFAQKQLPFAWCIDEGKDLEFQNKLIEHGFINGGVFQGVIGFLDQNSVLEPKLPEGCTIEAVETEAQMKEFADLMQTIFMFNEKTKELALIALWNGTKNTDLKMFHWAVRKEGKIVATLSTFIRGKEVSFWDGASVPELRKQGLCTALSQHAINHAVSLGCNVGLSYLMSEGMALGICNKLGSKTEWRFEIYLPESCH